MSHSYLLTNDTPSAADTALIRDFLHHNQVEIKDHDRQIRDLKWRIRKLEMEVDQLTYKKALLLETAKVHRGVMSAIRRFPAEILAEIFQHCLCHVDPQRLPAKNGPMKLSWVSQRWRAIALSNASLWTSPCTSPDPSRAISGEDLWPGHQALANIWLTRSRSLPLDLCLNCFMGYESESPSSKQLVETYFPHAARWKKVYLKLPCLFSLPHLPDLVAPQLESATLFLVGLGARELAWVLKLLRSPNSLRHLSWDGLELEGYAPVLSELTTFANLRTLSLNWQVERDEFGIPPLYVLRFCQLAPRLEEFVVNIGATDEEASQAERDALDKITVVHPTLTSIHIKSTRGDFYTDAELTEVFNRLTLPALSEVYVEGERCATWPAEAFHMLLERSSCALTSLSIAEFPSITGAEILDLLKHDSVKNSLTSLDLTSATGSGEHSSKLLPDSVLRFLSASESEITYDIEVWGSRAQKESIPIQTLEKIGLPIEPFLQAKLLRKIVERRTEYWGGYWRKVPEEDDGKLKHVRLKVAEPKMKGLNVEFTEFEKVIQEATKERRVVFERSSCEGMDYNFDGKKRLRDLFKEDANLAATST